MGLNQLSLSRITILMLALVLAGGVGAGYLGARFTYETKIQDYKDQIAGLTSEVSGLNSTIAAMETTISTLEATVSNYESQISQLESHYESEIAGLNETVSQFGSKLSNLKSYLDQAEKTIADYEKQVSNLEFQVSSYELQVEHLQTQVSNYELQVENLESQISSYKRQVENLQTQVDAYYKKISSLKSRLSGILDIEVVQHYQWVYGSPLWSERYRWELPLPLSLYVEYHERPRPASWSGWVEMALDPGDDYYIAQMVQQLNAAAASEGLDEVEKVNFVIAFVQSLPSTVEDVTAPWDGYPRYPIETLFNGGGDCEDTSILAAALLHRMGYDVALIFLHNEQHLAVGVSIEGAHGSFYSYQNRRFYYAETTGDGWELGEIPSDFTDTTAFIYPL